MTTTGPAAHRPPADPVQLGAYMAERLREHFPHQPERQRQALAHAMAEKACVHITHHRVADPPQEPRPMTTTPSAARPPEDLTDLTALGAFLADKLRDHFPRETEQQRQVLALAEEAGEFVGAYRRAAGMARRTGGWDQVRDELADVAITAHVTACVLDIRIEPTDTSPADPPRTAQDVHHCVMDVAAAAGWVADVYLEPEHRFALDAALCSLILTVERAAHVLAIDLTAAVRTKARIICSRGWRDQPPAANPTADLGGLAAASADGDQDDGREWAEAMLDAADALTYVIETSTHDTTRFQRAHHVLFGPAQDGGDGGQDDDVASCRVCGCTDDRACPGGCHWVPDPTMAGDLCSRCAPQEALR